MTKEERDIQRKLKVLRHAERTGHVARTCRYFGVGRSSFYRWKARTSNVVKPGLSTPSPFQRTLPTRPRPRSSIRFSICAASTTSVQSGSSGTWRAITASKSPTQV
jgi:hypothetical protein